MTVGAALLGRPIRLRLINVEAKKGRPRSAAPTVKVTASCSRQEEVLPSGLPQRLQKRALASF